MKPRISVSILLMIASCVARAQSPCGGGYDPLHDPRHPQAVCLEEIGHMYGLIAQCSENQSEQYGLSIYPLGDISGDGLADWIVAHQICDHLAPSAPYVPQEILLYKGVHGGLPTSASGERIGPTERGSGTTFLACGDWDGDGHRDIAVRIQIYGDTTSGNAKGYDIARLVIFWGNAAGVYTLADTTQLSCDSPMWLGINQALSADLNADGIADLLVPNSDGFGNGAVVPIANVLLYQGHHGKRWGHGTGSWSADWRWWTGPYVEFAALDQDHDGAMDIVMYDNDPDIGHVTVLYGNPTGGFPDTSAIQTIALEQTSGRYALFSDVTGDKVPELLVGSGRKDFVKVFIGLQGQRLLEQFGSGNDSGHIGADRWWGKPWAEIWLPRRVDPNWFGDNDRLFDLGDANLDGLNDIYAFSWPYLLEYNSGQYMDSLVDALYDIRPGAVIKTAVMLGDIDGSGQQTIAAAASGIAFLRGSNTIPSSGVRRRLPEGTGPAAVPQAETQSSIPFILNAIPNPSTGEVSLQWNVLPNSSAATITITDERGAEAAQYSADASAGRLQLPAHTLASGFYLVILHCGNRSATTSIVIR